MLCVDTIHCERVSLGPVSTNRCVDLARRASQDAGERGIENVVVSLYEAATGTLIGTRASDVTGKYQCKYYFILGFF